MTQNDNIRYYTGTLEPVEDIDVVFKHIYDLMLANGGEDSGLNADMVDGYHASDFAPASLINEINKCIHSITIGGRRYSDNDVVLELLAKDMSLTNNNNEPVNLETFLNNLDQSTQAFEEETNSTLDDLLERTDFMSDYGQSAISNLINNKITYIYNGSSGEDLDHSKGEFYLNADSVNGISFSIVTQQQYDALPNEQKKDPRNIFIINNNIGESISDGTYAPPSVLQAGLNFKLKVDTDTWNVLFSIDNGASWKIAAPLIGDHDNNGFLYPSNFEQIKEVMTADASYDSNMFNQDKYPFLLNDSAAKESLFQDLLNDSATKESLLQDRAKGIQIGGRSITADSNNPILNLDSLLTSYLDNRYPQQSAITNLNSTISGNMTQIADTYQRKSNLSTSISSPGTNTNYPSTKAVIDYIKSSQDSLAATLRREISKVALADSGWKTIYPDKKIFTQNPIYYRKIGKIVYFSGNFKAAKDFKFVVNTDNPRAICTFPNGFRPGVAFRGIGQCSMTDRCYIFIDSKGTMHIDRIDYHNTRSKTFTVNKDYWFSISGTFFTN